MPRKKGRHRAGRAVRPFAPVISAQAPARAESESVTQAPADGPGTTTPRQAALRASQHTARVTATARRADTQSLEYVRRGLVRVALVATTCLIVLIVLTLVLD